MSHRIYFWSIGIGTLGAWGAFGALVIMTTPTDSILLLTGFFGTLFLALAGTGIVIMTLIWCHSGACTQNHHRIVRALRHGTLLALLGSGCALMQWYGYLTWWSALIATGAVLVYELSVILVRRSF